MAVGDVRYFSRALEADAHQHEALGWERWGVEHIPSLPNEGIVLLEYLGEGEPRVPDDDRGLKFDDDKTRWDLLLVMLGQQTEQVVRGLMYGAKKYKENADDPNYRKIKDAKRRTTNAAIRHVVAYINGELLDEESGQPHLALAIVELLFAMWHSDDKRER